MSGDAKPHRTRTPRRAGEPPQRFVLDTSLFTNPDTVRAFDADPIRAIERFVELARASGASFYMPTAVYRELGLVRDLGASAPAFEAVVRIRSPRRHDLRIPSSLLYELIDDLRARIDRGLRIAEEHAKAAGAGPGDLGAVIHRLRERYREALRRGILDSREDVDVLLLALELDGTVVSADEGLRRWADHVGLALVEPRHFPRILEELAAARR